MSGSARFIVGTPAAEGVALGTISLPLALPSADEQIASTIAGRYTIDDYHRACQATAEQLAAFQRRIEGRLEEPVSALFAAHLAILADPHLATGVAQRIELGASVPTAIKDAFEHYIQAMSRSPSPSLREKAQDLIDLCRRLLANLTGRAEAAHDLSGRILLIHELLPSDLLRSIAQRVGGIILTSGGATAHISMLARSLRTPMVLAERELVEHLAEGTRVLLDANQGSILVEPDTTVVKSYAALLDGQRAAPAAATIMPATRTSDGRAIALLANVGLLSEIAVVRAVGAAGIGLYRSEIPFLVRDDLPSEEQQLGIYRRLLEGMEGRPVVFRALDIGGDKMVAYFPHDAQANPSLGLRGIRFLLRHQEVLRTQLRALLRAGAGRRLQIMFPLVSSVDAFLAIKAIVSACLQELAAAGIACNQRPELGVMVELPSAVGVVEELAEAVDFLSIGSNDLIQHILAVDRTNQTVTAWYIPYHPAVLRAIKRIADAAGRSGKPLSICGDMAFDPILLPVLLGMGISSFSVPPFAVPRVQQAIAGVDGRTATHLAARILALGRIAEIRQLLGIAPAAADPY